MTEPDERGFSDFFQHEFERLVRTAYLVLHDQQSAEDVAGESEWAVGLIAGMARRAASETPDDAELSPLLATGLRPSPPVSQYHDPVDG